MPAWALPPVVAPGVVRVESAAPVLREPSGDAPTVRDVVGVCVGAIVGLVIAYPSFWIVLLAGVRLLDALSATRGLDWGGVGLAMMISALLGPLLAVAMGRVVSRLIRRSLDLVAFAAVAFGVPATWWLMVAMGW